MGDSDDERRDDWNDREWDRGRERRSRGEYRDYDRGRRERFTPPRHDMSPQQKRMRRDWDDHGGDPYRGGYGPPQHWGHPDLHLMQPHHGIPIQARLGNLHDMDLGPPPPIMKTFKEFLLSLDDSVGHGGGQTLQRVQDRLPRQQMQDFFLAHKDEEWFRSKYHPDEASLLKAEAQSALHNRVNVFMFLMENSWFDNVSLDIEQTPTIIKVLDAAVIKMEGGTDHDLRILDLRWRRTSQEEDLKTSDGDRKLSVEKDKNEKEENDSASAERAAAAEGVEVKEEAEKEAAKEETPEPKKPRRKRKRSGDSDDEGTASDSDSDSDSDSNSNCSDKPNLLSVHEEHRSTISKAEIIALCRRYPGFLRVCLSDPHPERSVNIKEVCWNLQNIRVRDCELAPGVNRDLARRVRNVNGITQHKQVLRNDIKLAAKLIHSLDEKGDLWSIKSQEERHRESAELAAQNPILKKHHRLPDRGETTVERDDKLAKVLDRLVLYLRIVHSIDYYNTCEYPSEDEMPNRCGMIHVRGPIPPNRVTQGEVQQWQKMMEEKLSPLVGSKEVLSEDEAGKMGRKDPEEEVEKFVNANTQELGKDKWLCPLSGKKFKGPEFVRKHILNKHGDKIEEVKKEVVFFNNFLMDAKRPSLPEMKLPPLPGPGLLSPSMPFPPQGPQGPMGFGQPRPPLMGYGGAPPYPPQPVRRWKRKLRQLPRTRWLPGQATQPQVRLLMSRGDPRNIVEYRDLDAPDDMDFF
ncbi:hypothetical protein KUCAC02_002929 [Chaenocephalus aceratus]|uniref:Uncharacterized protein n=1 Tax=Chaenocephalus aceratus TaxID=36190 RepID=A0ACB9WJF9_CHAAC|nr:hypothetical protein KUCAC02_002929 [Chaenocephalus aceratus]